MDYLAPPTLESLDEENKTLLRKIERLRAAMTQIMELGYHSLDPDVDKRMTELARKTLFPE